MRSGSTRWLDDGVEESDGTTNEVVVVNGRELHS